MLRKQFCNEVYIWHSVMFSSSVFEPDTLVLQLIYIIENESIHQSFQNQHLVQAYNMYLHMFIYPDYSLMFKNACNLQTLVHKLGIDTLYPHFTHRYVSIINALDCIKIICLLSQPKQHLFYLKIFIPISINSKICSQIFKYICSVRSPLEYYKRL